MSEAKEDKRLPVVHTMHELENRLSMLLSEAKKTVKPLVNVLSETCWCARMLLNYDEKEKNSVVEEKNSFNRCNKVKLLFPQAVDVVEIDSVIHVRFVSKEAVIDATSESVDDSISPRLRLCVREGGLNSKCDYAMLSSIPQLDARVDISL